MTLWRVHELAAGELANGGGPCGGPCTPTPDAFFTRYATHANLTTSNFSISSEFVTFNSSKGGTCFGDSGPAFLSRTSTFIAVTSFGANAVCKGQGYSCRIDTPQALSFVNEVIAIYGP